ncbi:hypothetical protein L541_3163 [Bordetella hinzii CA90 BAL1384]|uniref:hypothetical protein n=1 Tax=Bordetella hinzii TaxID=103855 RepID=UPI00045A0EF9|nr:hypothetical protein [Bordetella hinzii]KCB31591.1 hypothetical protein L541_3163 [Bordetella hinzii CA90 BAL1384]
MYSLDTTAAKGAENTGSRITEMGKYKGKFTRAQHIVAKNTGTVGIDFDFVSDTGQKCRFSIYTIKSDGTTIYGFKQLNAIMACMSLRALADPQMRKCKVYDYDLKREVEVEVPQFAELLEKPIGLLFTMEEYDPGKWRPNLAGVFQANTELVASEILERKTQPLQLAKMVQALRDKPLRSGDASLEDGNRAAAAASAVQDPDIPF